MALKDWFSRRTLLQLALERGMRPGADLQSELFKLGEFTITSKADAEAVFQDRRSAYLRLFADLGAAELKRRGIPASTLRPDC